MTCKHDGFCHSDNLPCPPSDDLLLSADSNAWSPTLAEMFCMAPTHAGNVCEEAPAYAAALERKLDPARSYFATHSLPRLLLGPWLEVFREPCIPNREVWQFPWMPGRAFAGIDAYSRLRHTLEVQQNRLETDPGPLDARVS